MKKIILLASVAVFALSCKKSDGESSEETKKQQVVKLEDINGADTTVTSYEYTKDSRLSRIVADSTSWIKLEYYPNGDLAIIDSISINPLNKRRKYTVFTYGDSSKLKSAVVKIYNGSLLESTFSLAYAVDSGRVKAITSSRPGLVPSQQISYDKNGNVVKIISDGLMPLIETYTFNEQNSSMSNSRLKYYFGDFALPIDLYNANDKFKYTADEQGVLFEEIYTSEYSDGFPSKVKASAAFNGTGGNATVEGQLKFSYDLK